MAFTKELQAKLMSIFQNWSIQFIADYYEAERDLLGKQYINDVDTSYNIDKGKDLLEMYIREYPGAFLNLIDSIKGKTVDMPNPQEASEFAEWLMEEDRPENIRLIANALSKGFLCEWIAYHYINKEEFISLLNAQKPSVYDNWEYIYERKRMTRLEMVQTFGLMVDSLCYLYYKICRCNNLLVVFHALNTPSLRLGNNFKVIKEDFAYAGISPFVQRLYSNYCKNEYLNWDTTILFDHEEVPNRENGSHKNSLCNDTIDFFNDGIRRSAPNHHCSIIKIDRSLLFNLLCSIYESYKNESPKVVRRFWVALYNSLKEKNCINMDTKVGGDRSREPYSAFANLVNKEISPSIRLSKDWYRRLPELEEKDKPIVTSIEDDINKRLESFIEKSQHQKP